MLPSNSLNDKGMMESKSAGNLLTARLQPQIGVSSNVLSSSKSQTSLKPKVMIPSKSTPVLNSTTIAPGSNKREDPSHTFASKSLSTSASAAILSANPEFHLHSQDTSDLKASGHTHKHQHRHHRRSEEAHSADHDKPTINSFIGSLNLSEDLLNELFKVPHTFFYLRLKSNGAEKSSPTSMKGSGFDHSTEERGHNSSVYELELASLEEIDKNFYFTLSREGVTQFYNKVSTFTTLTQWEREYRLFHKIANINFFKVYKRWKVRYV
jgi:hypothetical protein